MVENRAYYVYYVNLFMLKIQDILHLNIRLSISSLNIFGRPLAVLFAIMN